MSLPPQKPKARLNEYASKTPLIEATKKEQR